MYAIRNKWNFFSLSLLPICLREIEEFFKTLNSHNLSIKFKIEKEQDKSISFIDLRIYRNNEKLEFDIYGNSTNTDNFIHKTSNTTAYFTEFSSKKDFDRKIPQIYHVKRNN